MIVITGAGGFIWNVVAGALNKNGFENLVLVDDFSRADKNLNFEHIAYQSKIHRDDFISFLNENPTKIDFIFIACGIFEITFSTPFFNSKAEVKCISWVVSSFYWVVVLVHAYWEYVVKFIVEIVFPFEPYVFVGIRIGRIGIQSEHIVTDITT